MREFRRSGYRRSSVAMEVETLSVMANRADGFRFARCMDRNR